MVHQTQLTIMKHLFVVSLFVTTLLACGGEDADLSAKKDEFLISTTWDLYAIDGVTYDWKTFYKIYYTFAADGTVEMSSYDTDINQTRSKITGKWQWKGSAGSILYLDFRLPNGNGNQYNWAIVKLDAKEFLYTDEDDNDKGYWLVPKK